eukprot:TRINITY_DN912_c0_g1_i1.p1 TRINITY_DN912_c0_g1~~TRINITY_DN912_c0_g1_i1.p1  ORF type:complete len:338 (-),score=87.51 TRINITY_DN912_c0_g1_i1:3-1016(-)
MASKRENVIKNGDRVLIYESYDKQKVITMKFGDVYQCRFGAFQHNTIIDRPYGSKIMASNQKGYINVLRFTPELWTFALSHRTQILYEADIMAVIMNMHIRPGSVVVEAGTGSGSLSTALARAVAPTGRLFTFEFHEKRAEMARAEFKENKLDDVVTLEHRDVIRDGLPSTLPPVTAAFFDLPDASAVIQHIAPLMAQSGVVCTFCPCIEQVQRVIPQLTKFGFAGVKTIEVILRKFEVKLWFEQDVIFSTGQPADDTNTASVSEPQQTVQQPLRPNKRKVDEDDLIKDLDAVDPDTVAGKQYKLCTRPYPDMRGHTGYLTFAYKLPNDQLQAATVQ